MKYWKIKKLQGENCSSIWVFIKKRVGTSLSLWVYIKFRSDPIVPKKAENDDKIGQMKKIETKNYNRLV